MKNFEKVIRITQQIIQIIINDHSDFAERLNNLKNKFENRYERTETMKNLEKIIRITRQII